MAKTTHSAEHLLDHLGALSQELTSKPLEGKSHFDKPPQIVNEVMGFHVSVLYKIANVIESDLILEVMGFATRSTIVRIWWRVPKYAWISTIHRLNLPTKSRPSS
jgi:hypothetical protein